ncbi:MAG: RNA-binding protein [Candidatus Pacearchaeota archaeon]|nr:MAG: RNA-binding protein [Candidatus Pacearchaeota archaeon]
MSKRIYIGNLPWKIDKKELEKIFSVFGKIEDAIVIINRHTGKSKGFGFVTFSEDKDARKAIDEMNGKEVLGRKILVKEARPLGI